jgi:hypothetical protein
VSELWDAYHEIKSVRRALKAAGASDARVSPTSEHGNALREQMPRLDTAQLTLEKLFGTVDHEPDVFRPYDQRLQFLLRIAEQYTNHVFNDWEDGEKSENKYLPCFLGKATGPGGIKYLSEAVHRAADLVYALRSGNKSKYPTDPKVDCDLRSDKPFPSTTTTSRNRTASRRWRANPACRPRTSIPAFGKRPQSARKRGRRQTPRRWRNPLQLAALRSNSTRLKIVVSPARVPASRHLRRPRRCRGRA